MPESETEKLKQEIYELKTKLELLQCNPNVPITPEADILEFDQVKEQHFLENKILSERVTYVNFDESTLILEFGFTYRLIVLEDYVWMLKKEQ